jgi:hypothetical protein
MHSGNTDVSATAAFVGVKLLFRYRFSLREIAEILTDEAEPLSLRGLQSWATGQYLRVEPSLRVEGHRNSAWGIGDVMKFCMCKKLIRGFGSTSLPAAGINSFLTCWQGDDFFKGIGFAEKMTGTVLLVPDADTPAELTAYFFPAEKESRYTAAVKILALEGKSFCTLRMADVACEVLARLNAWLDGKPYVPHRMTHKGFAEAMKTIREVTRGPR